MIPICLSGRLPVPVPGHWQAPPRQAHAVTCRVTASRWPRRRDVTGGRDHNDRPYGPQALPPGPLPKRVHSPNTVCRCVRAPTGVCEGLGALFQRCTSSGSFTARRGQTREAHWRRGPGFLSRQVWIAPKICRSWLSSPARAGVPLPRLKSASSFGCRSRNVKCLLWQLVHGRNLAKYHLS